MNPRALIMVVAVLFAACSGAGSSGDGGDGDGGGPVSDEDRPDAGGDDGFADAADEFDGAAGDECVPDWRPVTACACQPSECAGCSGFATEADGCGHTRETECALPPAGCAGPCCGATCCPAGYWCAEDQCTQSYPRQRVGIFYLAWHAYAWDAVQQLPESDRPTIETVVREPERTFSEMLNDHGLMGSAASFHFHAEPRIGFYSLYRARPGEAPYPEPDFVPDSPNAAAVAEIHARQLWEAGVDFVFVDSTNLAFLSPFADVLGLRPIEVLFEEWRALRQRGVMTPQIAVWVPIPARPAEHSEWIHLAIRYLDLYNRPEYADLVLTDGKTRKKVMFIVDHGGLPPDPAVEAALQANGGRNDVLTPHLWGLLGAGDFAAGKAAWMQPCQTADGQWTTLVAAGVPCAQGYARNSPLGTVLSVSTSYQLAYASLPFQASGKMNGLTFQKQFETAFQVQPDYLLINSWNELIAQPQPNPYVANLGNLGRSLGKYSPPQAPSTPGLDWLWVDAYGAEFVRDIEPTVEYGTKYLDLLASCLRVYRSGVRACTPEQMTSESCCQVDDEYVLIDSLRVKDPQNSLSTHHVLTPDALERDTLLGSGAWEQVCNPVYGPPGLCGKDRDLTADGPFMLFARPGPDRAPLYRCWSGADNFFSLDPDCEGREVVRLLGYLSTVRGTASPRPLLRCYHPAGPAHFHWLEEACPAGREDAGRLGFVR